MRSPRLEELPEGVAELGWDKPPRPVEDALSEVDDGEGLVEEERGNAMLGTLYISRCVATDVKYLREILRARLDDGIIKS